MTHFNIEVFGNLILQPICKSQGKGIFLFRDLKEISDWKKGGKEKKNPDEVEVYIVQRYIERPLLVGGKKFDMRIYVLGKWDFFEERLHVHFM